LTVYIDASFLVSVYIKDRHSSITTELLRSRPQISLTPFHCAEWAHAIAQHVFRGVLTLPEADNVYDQFAKDEAVGLWTEIPMPDHAFAVCIDLARRYGPNLGTRTLDSLHVACALELKATHFWTFDERQAKLAKTKGLKTN
jgi:predicted nucleic acid-binding protein